LELQILKLDPLAGTISSAINFCRNFSLYEGQLQSVWECSNYFRDCIWVFFV